MSKNGKKQAKASDQKAATKGTAMKCWNFLVYMASDNDLKEESVYSLTEILRAGTIPEIQVIAQLDSGNAVTLYDFKAPSGEKIGAGFRHDSLDGYGEPLVSASEMPLYFSDSEALKDFLTKKLDASCSNLVVLSGHGNGAVGNFLPTNNPPSAMNIAVLRSVLAPARRKLGRPIDVLGLDSCLMSMAEVGYELRGLANFLVGAEGYARNAGWPYREILTAMRKDAEILTPRRGDQTTVPKALARLIVREYIRFYAPYTVCGVSVDQTACDLNAMDKLATAIRALAELLRDGLTRSDKKIEDAVLLAHWRAQSYKLEQYVDLWDFCDLLSEDLSNSDIAAACGAVKLAIQEVAFLSCFSGGAFQYSHGLSVYFPWAKAEVDRNLPQYSNLDFARNTHWDEFLDVYGKKTQRQPNKNGWNKKGVGAEVPMPSDSDVVAGMVPGGVRTNLMEGTRTNLVEGTRTNLVEGTRGGRIITPMVKNPPDTFLKYTDDCAEENGSPKQQSAKQTA